MKNKLLELLELHEGYQQLSDILKNKVADILIDLVGEYLSRNPKAINLELYGSEVLELIDDDNELDTNSVIYSIISGIVYIVSGIDDGYKEAFIHITIKTALLAGLENQRKLELVKAMFHSNTEIYIDTYVCEDIEQIVENNLKDSSSNIVKLINNYGITRLDIIVGITASIDGKLPAIDKLNEIVDNFINSYNKIDVENSKDAIIGLILNRLELVPWEYDDPEDKLITAIEFILKLVEDHIEPGMDKYLTGLYNVVSNDSIIQAIGNVGSGVYLTFDDISEYNNLYSKIKRYIVVTGRAPKHILFYSLPSILEDEEEIKNRMLNIHKYLTFKKNNIQAEEIKILIEKIQYLPGKYKNTLNLMAEVGPNRVIAAIDRIAVAAKNKEHSELYLDWMVFGNLIEQIREIETLEKFTYIFAILGRYTSRYVMAALYVYHKMGTDNCNPVLMNIDTTESRDKVLYRLIFGLDAEIKPELLGYINKAIKAKTSANIRNIPNAKKIYDIIEGRNETVIPTTEIVEAGYTLRELPKDDIRGPIIGVYTSCCQRIGDWGEFCAIHSVVSENAANIVVMKDNNIVANSWVWSRGDIIVFDNIEVKEGPFIDKNVVKELFVKYSKFLIEKGITEVRIGAGNNDIDISSLVEAGDLVTIPEIDEIGSFSESCELYSDAKDKQLIIAKKVI